MLADEGTVIRKFFLHISKEEQAARLQARIDNPHKHWKFRKEDLAERERWDDYQAGLRGGDPAHGHARTRRGSWCPPTGSGTATW